MISLQKVLVIQTSFIGDVILATAVLEKLHRHHPTARLDFMLRKGNESLLEHHPFLGKLYVWDKKDKYRTLFKLWREVRREHYDLVVNLQRFASTGFLTAFSGAKHTVGFRKNPFSFLFTKAYPHQYRPNFHEIHRNQTLIAPYTDAEPSRPCLYPSENDFQFVREYQRVPYVCIAPGSVWATKQFPLAKWEKFLSLVSFEGKIYLLGAKSDEKICHQLAQYHRHCEVLAGKLTLLQSAALMEKALMNYVNDSSPLHLASARNAPVTAIFCSTTPVFGFYPLSDKQYVIQTSRLLPCRPCGIHGKKVCPEKHFACAETISVEQLLETMPK
ncbi:MAG: glycosyltransferase family 9 protein [Flammeovirgaceae bacterium]|nr:glycosyltransferase family 9 protein [Flammeovirgaceae bacterium]MDW8286896.1 glycosyltransferase family 9 protein [Flammeovirgaceae bacterium]